MIADVNLSVRTARMKFGRKEVKIHDEEKEDLGVLVYGKSIKGGFTHAISRSLLIKIAGTSVLTWDTLLTVTNGIGHIISMKEGGSNNQCSSLVLSPASNH